MNSDSRRSSHLLSYTLFAASLILFLLRIYREIGNPPDQRFGTFDAPYSDALGIWVGGMLNYLFLGEPSEILYRPTGGLFFSSLFNVWPNLIAIPTFFITWLTIIILLCGITNVPRIRITLALWLFLLSLVSAFDQTLAQALIGTTMVDFPATVFTVAGILLLVGALKSRQSLLAFAISGLLLGVSAALRGPFLVVFPALVLMIFFSLKGLPARIKSTLVFALLFFLPPAFDTITQKQFGIVNNGVASLHCFVHDAAHSWVPECHARYLKARPSTGTVLQEYGSFIMSGEGAAVLQRYVQGRVLLDTRVVANWTFLGLMLTTYLLSRLVKSNAEGNKLWSRLSVKKDLRTLALATGAWLLLWVTTPQAITIERPLIQPLILIMSVLLMMFLAYREKKYLSWICFLSYLGGITFMTLSGLPFLARIAATFSFALPLGFLSYLGEGTPTEEKEEHFSRGVTATAILHGVIVLFLYGAAPLMHTKYEERFLNEVLGKKAAIKIADAPPKDRSLYYTGEKKFYYTHHDEREVGSVRTYSEVSASNGDGNASLFNPAEFIDSVTE